MIDVLNLVAAERRRQDSLWGPQNHDLNYWYVILGEEFGEVGKALCDLPLGKATLDEVRSELIQTAAVAVAIVECIDRNRR